MSLDRYLLARYGIGTLTALHGMDRPQYVTQTEAGEIRFTSDHLQAVGDTVSIDGRPHKITAALPTVGAVRLITEPVRIPREH